MRLITDQIQITIPIGEDKSETRWWEIRQPPPSVALSLQGALSNALGAHVIEAVWTILATRDQELDGNLSKDFSLNKDFLGESHAAKIFRNTRLGRSLSHPGEDIGSASDRLRILLKFVSKRFGVNASSALLFGTADRKKGSGFDWVEPSLVHRLLLSSGLKYSGTAEKPRSPTGAEGDTSPGAKLYDAVQHGSLTMFTEVLDSLVHSADELLLLGIWATCHLFRPF